MAAPARQDLDGFTPADGGGEERRPPSDPVADLAALWLALDVVAERSCATPAGEEALAALRGLLGSHLALAEPSTLKGASRALALAGRSSLPEGLRRRMIEVAQALLRRRLGGAASRSDNEEGEPMQGYGTPRGHAGRKQAPWRIEIEVRDDALKPTLNRGCRAWVDTSERNLADGGVYALREGDRLALWLYTEGAAGAGSVLAGHPAGSLLSLGGTFRCRAPVDPKSLVVVGRVVTPDADDEPSLEALAAERAALLAARDGVLADLGRALALGRRPSGEPRADTRPDLRARLRRASTLAEAGRALDEALGAPGTGDLLRAELRLDAFAARLSAIETKVATLEARSIEDVRQKLRLLWELHYAPFPGQQDDLAAQVIRTALDGLDGFEVGPRPDAASARAEGGPQGLQLVEGAVR